MQGRLKVGDWKMVSNVCVNLGGLKSAFRRVALDFDAVH